MDFNQLKDLKSTWGENRTIVPEWVEGQSFYVVSDELLKQLINEINESRLLREQIAGEALELLKHLGLKPNKCGCPAYPDGETWDGHMCMEFQLLDLITKDEKLSDAIARGNL